MKTESEMGNSIFFRVALICLIIGLFSGCLAAGVYLFPDLLKEYGGFQALRPLHVSFVLFWILIGSTGVVYFGLGQLSGLHLKKSFRIVHASLWILALAGVFYSYICGHFGGREYWEFPPVVSILILGSWICFVVNVIFMIRKIVKWPVYVWMWMTGSLFFLFIFMENYLWLLPYFRKNTVADMTIQWKVNGSIVGAWNQLIYGSAFFLLDRIKGDNSVGRNRTAFLMYFLGLFNLMFNWGHHIYTLPTAPYVKYIGYLVSMTEWVFFARIVYTWKQSLTEYRRHMHIFSYRFIVASELWVFINMFQAVLMSVPAINLYTHGTHVTVAHAMGTTIGINTMILFSLFFFIIVPPESAKSKWLNWTFITLQMSLFVFWLSLLIAGIKRGLWQMNEAGGSFSRMMQSLQPWFIAFLLAGIIMAICIITLCFFLLVQINRRKSLRTTAAT